MEGRALRDRIVRREAHHERRRSAPPSIAIAFALMISTSQVAAQTCPADCNTDQRVVIDELVTAVRIALAQIALDACASADTDGDDRVRVNDLVAAVNVALRGCGVATPTPTRTTTASVATPTPTRVAGTPQWEARAPLPAARQELGVAELGGRIYTVGGFDSQGRATAVVEYYEPASDMWFGAAALPQPLHHVPVAVTGDHLYAIGGLRGGTFAAVDDVFRYDPVRNVWDEVTGLPGPRGAGAAAVIDGLIYLAGGARGGSSVRDFAVFDPAVNAWTQLPPMPTARDHLAAAAINGIFYAVGGRFSQLFDALEAYDPATREWTTLAPLPTARGGLAAAALGGRLFTFGGEGNPAAPDGIFREVETCSPPDTAWVLPYPAIASTSQAARQSPASARRQPTKRCCRSSPLLSAPFEERGWGIFETDLRTIPPGPPSSKGEGDLRARRARSGWPAPPTRASRA
jgi:hypothetical protein